MTKLRRNHSSSKTSSGIIKFAVYGFVLLGILLYGLKGMDFSWLDSASSNLPKTALNDAFIYPSDGKGEMVYHTNYTLSYREDHEQAEWVAYVLTRENLKKPNVERTGRFNPDYSVTTRSAFHRDYSRSGYTRGHLAPAGDMAQDITAMKESFFMSNISPQIRPFNNGIWKELEETVRDWAFSAEKLVIVTGPVLESGIIKKIGQNKVSVPSKFYKILLDPKESKEKMIAFLIPNAKSDRHLKEYMITVDEIEQITGLDFFNDLLDNDLEETLESQLSESGWKFSEKRFRLRVEKWNEQ